MEQAGETVARRADRAGSAMDELYRAALDATRRRRRSRRRHVQHRNELRELYDRNRTLLNSLPDE